ncbi:diacylglycerol kinase family protein [Alteromonas stellipolaris]|uniref:diacylglycerol kinase family protein n=1 Tax=Alteromonas stellipolaris TaxID=233316 RepID=UPI001DD5CBCE|nr:diacylglycerol kinase family protein [Alteromonas stellipolaris]MBZ2162849.1 dual specificity protein phosphatase family protein [Alteromonas stellipolaris]
MKMVKYYVLGAILALMLTWFSPTLWLSVIFAWISFSLIAVSSAYLLNYPALFRKREDGSIPIYIRWVFVPFLLGSWLYNEYARRTDKVPPFQRIDDQLYLGCRMSSQHVDMLKNNNINAILDVTAEFDGLDWTAYQLDFDYLNIPVLDHTSPTQEQLTLAINWLDQQLVEGKNVVVHCALGRGRSVLVLAAYLLARDPSLSILDAMDKIQAVRSTARLNKHQLAALEKIKNGGSLSLTKRLTLIANPVAGGGKWEVEKADILSRLNEKFKVTVKETTAEVNGEVLAKEALVDGAQIIVACGGDGTITEVANALTDKNVTLGVIPLGTANALCQVLHGYASKIVPISTACDIIINGKTADIDTAQCNGRMMLLVAAVGFEEHMISAADRGEKDSGGQFAYLKGLWEAIGKNDNLSFQVKFDEEEAQHLDTPSLVIANAAPITTALAQGGNLPDVTDGKLDITWLTPQDSSDRQLLSLAELVFGPEEYKTSSDSIRHKQTPSISLHFDEEVSYAVDGEIFSAREINITTHPASLRVLTGIDHVQNNSQSAAE